MTEPIVDTLIAGTWSGKDGKKAVRAIKTGPDGRATFTDLPVGSTFRAQALVEGESLLTSTVTIPASGGTRLLLIAGSKTPQSADEMAPGASLTKPATPQPFAVRSGKVEPRDGMKAGTIDIQVFSADNKPLPAVTVDLGRAKVGSKEVEFKQAVTDASGIAHFTDIEASEGSPYAALVRRDGMRVGSEAFALDPKRGAFGEIHIPGKTNELSVLRVSASSRMMLEVREDAISVLQNLIIENTSDKIFDPGTSGLLVPLPDGFVGAEKLPGGTDVDLKEGVGAFLHSMIPPAQSIGSAAQVRLGYLLTTHETPSFEIIHPMPLGMAGGLVMIPAEFSVTLSAPGLRTRANERDDNGNELRMYDLDVVHPGQALRLTVHGLPTRDQAGKWIAAGLAALLVLAGIFFGARQQQAPAPLGEKAG
jgi:hypothetical protein